MSYIKNESIMYDIVISHEPKDYNFIFHVLVSKVEKIKEKIFIYLTSNTLDLKP